LDYQKRKYEVSLECLKQLIVIPILQNAGHKVIAVQLPLHSLADDVASTKRAIDHIGGPVILVGHSYGGFVITPNFRK
jgi:pimeloyl-ACP methyl ester carboxylesterase